MASEQKSQSDLYRSLALVSPKIIPNFKYLWGAIIGFLVLGGYFIFTRDNLAILFVSTIGPWLGRVTLVLLGIIVLPGILGRFRIEIPITRAITLFRRQLGITAFLLGLTHYEFVRGIPLLSGLIPFKLPFPLFETLGFWALTILFFLFLTSNNFSQKKLGKWWKRLHRLIYVVLWLLVFHSGLQRISSWSVLITLVAILEVASLIYAATRKKPSASS